MFTFDEFTFAKKTRVPIANPPNSLVSIIYNFLFFSYFVISVISLQLTGGTLIGISKFYLDRHMRKTRKCHEI